MKQARMSENTDLLEELTKEEFQDWIKGYDTQIRVLQKTGLRSFEGVESAEAEIEELKKFKEHDIQVYRRRFGEMVRD